MIGRIKIIFKEFFMDNKFRGAVYMCVSALGMALMAACVKMVGSDVSTFQKLFFRNVVNALVVLVSMSRMGISVMPKSKKSAKFIFYRSIVGLTGATCFFYAISNLPLADSNMLNKLSPFFVMIFACLFLKEKFHRIQVVPLLMVFTGAVLVIKPTFNVEIYPALIGFISAVFAGGAYTLIRYLRTMEEPNTIVFWFAVISFVFMFPPMMATGFVVPDMRQLIFLIGSGVFATVGQVAISYAYKYAPANEVSIYQYLSIIFSALIGGVVLGEIPDIYSIFGGVFIMGAALINFYITNRVIAK